MAFEALNHAGIENTNILVILNDNCMSIDPNVGALKEYLTDITTSKPYNRFRDDIAFVLGKLSQFGTSELAGANATRYGPPGAPRGNTQHCQEQICK